MHDCVIIGGGPAGLTAALYLARAGMDAVLLEKAYTGGQITLTGEMENYPGLEEPVAGVVFAQRLESQAKRFGADIRQEQAVSLDLNGRVKRIHTEDHVYECRTVILASGANPKKLGIPGEDRLTGIGVSWCATCDGMFYRDRDVAVIGGGDTAAEEAIYLSRICRKVYMVHRRDKLRAISVLAGKVARTDKIEICWQAIPLEIQGDTSVTGLKVRFLQDGAEKVLAVDGVFIAIGYRPENALLAGKVDLSEDGYILTDEMMQTSVDGVFAAGDIRHKTLRQVVTACADGAVAAQSAEHCCVAMDV